MAAIRTQAELDDAINETREAIRRVLVSQSQGGISSIQRANLTELRNYEKSLVDEYAARFGGTTSGGPVFVSASVRRS